jgi:hypothetical protein
MESTNVSILHAVLDSSDPKYNANLSWEGSLEYARENTNDDLRNMKQKFRIKKG